MVVGRKWVLKRHFDGEPTADAFDLVEEELPKLKEGEIQIKTQWISVDPYMLPYTKSMTPPLTMIGSSVALVEDSRNSKYPKGSSVISYAGWVERAVVNPESKMRTMPMCVPAPPLPPAINPSLLLGACGMPGNTAYFGFLEICQPKAGETVVVSGAAGAVGSLVGQIAKIKGCTVIGYAGTDDKVEWLKELGFDHAFNYKKVSVKESLSQAAPNGVDCYFDNVGGEMSISVMEAMNKFGRVSVCGAISQYAESKNNSRCIMPLCVFKELKIEGFLVPRWLHRWEEGIKAMAGWVAAGKIKARETVMEGFTNTPNAMVGLFKGTNTGKMIVKV